MLKVTYIRQIQLDYIFSKFLIILQQSVSIFFYKYSIINTAGHGEIINPSVLFDLPTFQIVKN